MNAIILAAGKGIRMRNDGVETFKPLLPILGVQNLERTVLMLKHAGIQEIIILVNSDYIKDFLRIKYNYGCELIPLENSVNNLHTIYEVIDRLNDTFIIEGDVVLAKNVFKKFNHSVYYVKEYLLPENDAWCPICSKDKIVDFKIGKTDKACLFGISFWHKNDCPILVDAIKEAISEPNASDPNIFWDDCVLHILDKLHICVYKINQLDAFEMNNRIEYNLAVKHCKKYYDNCRNFMLDASIVIDNSSVYNFSEDIQECYSWQHKLLEFVEQDRDSFCATEEIKRNAPASVFGKDEYPFILRDELKRAVGYIDIAESTDYVLLRRLIIDEKLRKRGIGSNIIKCIFLYCQLTNRELRVNVYSIRTENFYKKNMFALGYKTYIKKT